MRLARPARRDQRGSWGFVTGLLVAGTALAATPDPAQLDACAERAWKRDVAGWAEYVFDRRVVLTDLDGDGRVRSRKERLFRMTPGDRGFDERLISEDGRPATNEEIREFRRKANFSRAYSGAARLEFSNPLGENLVLMPVLQAQEFRFAGEEELDGIACYRWVFDARPAPRRGSTHVQLIHAVRGSTCVSVEGCHVVFLELETIRPIKQSLTTIDYLRVTVRGRALDDGWVPASIEARFDLNVLGRHFRRVSSFRYSRFRRAP